MTFSERLLVVKNEEGRNTKQGNVNLNFRNKKKKEEEEKCRLLFFFFFLENSRELICETGVALY